MSRSRALRSWWICTLAGTLLTFGYLAATAPAAGAAPATALVSSQNPSTLATPARFTATVSPVGCTGTVTFTSDGNQLGTVALGADGKAVIFPYLPLGTHQIVAQYSGGGACQPSTSSPLSQTVTKQQTTTTLVSSVNPTTPNNPAKFTATITAPPGSTPALTGTVNFVRDGSVALGTVPVDSQGKATIWPAMPAGNHVVQAFYSGDGIYNPSSASLTQHVNQIPTVLTADPAVAQIGPDLAIFFPNLNAHLTTNNAPLAGKLITFRTTSGSFICSVFTDATGTATCSGSVAAVLSLGLGYDAFFGPDPLYASSSAHAPLVNVAGIQIAGS